jgi:hypothetical protein
MRVKSFNSKGGSSESPFYLRFLSAKNLSSLSDGKLLTLLNNNHIRTAMDKRRGNEYLLIRKGNEEVKK